MPIPASLLAECLPPVIDPDINYEGSLVLNEQLLSVVEICNKQISAIARIEALRLSPDEAALKVP